MLSCSTTRSKTLKVVCEQPHEPQVTPSLTLTHRPQRNPAVKVGDRIAQLILERIFIAEVEQVEDLGETYVQLMLCFFLWARACRAFICADHCAKKKQQTRRGWIRINGCEQEAQDCACRH